MPSQAQYRAELERALRAAGCRIDLDTALASPALARCLELTADALRRQPPTTPATSSTAFDVRAARLRRMVGDLDHQALRAGTDDN